MAPKRSAAALASPAPPSFLVKLEKRDLEALRIPASFYKQLLQEDVELELLPSKRRYFVVAGAGAAGAGVFSSGWKAFCKNNGIKEGDSIVFKASKDGSNVLTCKVYGPDGCVKQEPVDEAGSSRKRTRDSGVELISSDDEGDDNRDENLEAAVADGIKAALAMPDLEREIVFTNCQIRLSIQKLGGQIRTETPATKDALTAKDTAAVAASPARASRSVAAKNKKAPVVGGSGKKVSPATETPEPETTKAAVPRKATPKASVKKASPGARKARKTASATKAAAASAAKAKATTASPKATTASPKATTASPKRAAASPRKPASPASKKVTTPEPVSPARSRLQSKLDAAVAASPSKTPAEKTASGKKAKAKDSLLGVQKTVKTKRPGIKTPGKSSGKKPAPPATPGEARALARARSFTSANPHEVLVMKKSNLAPSFLLAVPRTFARESLPSDISELEMLNQNDKAWNVRWLPTPKMTFSGGWVYFAQDNELQTGDACVIELLGEKRVKMHIFRASESDDAAAATDAANERQETVVHSVTTMTTKTTVVAATAQAIRVDDDDDDEDYNPEEDEEEDEVGAGRRLTAAAGPTPLEPADIPPVSMVAPAS